MYSLKKNNLHIAGLTTHYNSAQISVFILQFKKTKKFRLIDGAGIFQD
jgi:hypothetical protein